MKISKVLWNIAATSVVAFYSVFGQATSSMAVDTSLVLKASEMKAPPGFVSSVDKVELGKTLFFDPRLSSASSVSCNSCHNVMAGGDDSLKTSFGVFGQKGGRNSPTVWNSGFQSVQFWDGRANTLEDQAKGPITNPIEMGMKDHSVAVSRLTKIDGYRAMFSKVYGEKIHSKKLITIERVADAIAAFERTLVTVNAPFDRFVAGEQNAISSEAKSGWQSFQSVGCISCHSGATFSGPSMPLGVGFYQKFPLMPDAGIEKAYEISKDLGRQEVTKQEADKNMWRVPMLRNVSLTAPYFHNGSVNSLSEAVRVMGKTQLGKDLSKKEISNIVAFLNTLTGEFQKREMPRLPDYSGTSFAE
ncbi:MAG: c-type cytochrome [Deltaproteobacteria bacterium]|jgi:cytochrome c peroxidase|nr:c-type cytochrome [Deltaproteobacteria bacterium]